VRFEPRLLGSPQIEFHHTQNQTKVLLPERILPVDKQTYPIDNLLGTGRSGLTGFFYRQKDRLFLATLKSGIKIERPGNSAPLKNQKDWEIASTGTQLHVLGLPRPTSSTIAKGVRDWRSFMVKAGQQSLLLQFDSPEIYTLAYSDLEDIRITTGDTQQQTTFRVNLALGDWDKMNEGYIHLHNVSRLVGGETSAILELQDTLLKRELKSFTNWEQPLILTAPGGQQRISNGEPAWIGENNMAAVQIDLLEPPMQLALLTLLLLVIAKMLAAISARLSALHLLMAGAIELFVIFRVLLGYRVWILPPFEDQAMRFALTAWAFLPWAFIVVSLRNYTDKQQNIWGWLPAVSGLMFSAIWCYQINDGDSFAWAFIAIHILVLLVPFFQFPDRKRSFAQAKTMPWHQSILSKLKSLVPKNKWMTENPWLILAMLLGFLRIVMVFFGAKESLVLAQAERQRFFVSTHRTAVIQFSTNIYLAASGVCRRLRPASFKLAGFYHRLSLAYTNKINGFRKKDTTTRRQRQTKTLLYPNRRSFLRVSYGANIYATTVSLVGARSRKHTRTPSNTLFAIRLSRKTGSTRNNRK
jgi:hypothetical protein